MNNIEVLNFGSLNIDHVYRVPHFVAPGETLACVNYQVFAGGKGLNQSIAMARAGIKIAHAGKIGHDGEFLAQTLRDSNVDTSFLITGDVPTGHGVIQLNEAGQNAIVLYPGANCALTRDEITSILDQQTPGTWLVLQNEINEIPFIMRYAHEKGLKIAINPAPCTDAVNQYPLELVDLLFVNEIEAAQLARSEGSFEEIAETLAKMLPQAQIIVTLGAAGAIWQYGNQRHFEPAVKTEVVDTTSAGDTFCGYFLASLLKGCTPQQAMKFSALASSITVSKAGAAVSIPAASEVFG